MRLQPTPNVFAAKQPAHYRFTDGTIALAHQALRVLEAEKQLNRLVSIVKRGQWCSDGMAKAIEDASRVLSREQSRLSTLQALFVGYQKR